MTAQIETYGRGSHTAMYGENDLASFFALSRIIDKEWLPHTPFLVFTVEDDTVKVSLAWNSYELVRDYAPSTKVMVQWPGRDRSDFFQMTVGDVRDAMERKGIRLPEVASSDTPDDRVGRCTDCGRRTKGDEIGNPCRAMLPQSSLRTYCRGRIVKPVSR